MISIHTSGVILAYNSHWTFLFSPVLINKSQGYKLFKVDCVSIQQRFLYTILLLIIVVDYFLKRLLLIQPQKTIRIQKADPVVFKPTFNQGTNITFWGD